MEEVNTKSDVRSSMPPRRLYQPLFTFRMLKSIIKELDEAH
jgi:hypothetical protein